LNARGGPNRDLEEEVVAKRFREDLYFRLNGVTLATPPLRERIDELPALAALFLDRVAQQVGVPAPRLTPEAVAQLCAYAWPGNLRELRNVLERALLLASAGSITPEHLPKEKLQRRTRSGGTPAPAQAAPAPAPAASDPPLTLLEIEKQAMVDALARCAGNQTRAAELLGMPRRTFCKRMGEYRIARPRA
jgi:DNA-binding NtrC family response regulator